MEGRASPRGRSESCAFEESQAELGGWSRVGSGGMEQDRIREQVARFAPSIGGFSFVVKAIRSH